MKKLLLFIFFIILSFSIFSQSKDHKHYLGKNVAHFSAPLFVYYASPSYAFDFFTIENSTGKYKVGISPSVGYGLKCKTANQKQEYLFAIDLYVGCLAENEDNIQGLDYFNINFVPVFSVYNWFGIGYGITFKRGLDGKANKITSLLTFGMRKTF